jgi:hypothetical protein
VCASLCFVQNIDNVDDFCLERGVKKLRTLAEHRLLQQQQHTKRVSASRSDVVADVASPPIGDVQMWCGAVSESQ